MNINEFEKIFTNLDSKIKKKALLINEQYQNDSSKINKIFGDILEKQEYNLNQYRESLLTVIKNKLNEEMENVDVKNQNRYLIYYKNGYETIDYVMKMFNFTQPLSFEMVIDKYSDFLSNKIQINLDSINLANPVYSKLAYDFLNLTHNKKLLVYNDKISSIHSLVIIDNKGKILKLKKFEDLVQDYEKNYINVKKLSSKIIISLKTKTGSHNIRMFDFNLKLLHNIELNKLSYNKNVLDFNDDIIIQSYSNDEKQEEILVINSNNLKMKLIKLQNEDIAKPFFIYSGEFSKDETNSDNYGYPHDYFSFLIHFNEENIYFLRYEAEVIDCFYILNWHTGKNVNLVELFFQDSYLLQFDSRSNIYFCDFHSMNVYDPDGDLLKVVELGYRENIFWSNLYYDYTIDIKSKDLLVYCVNGNEDYLEYYEY